jgi:hypothetical protein
MFISAPSRETTVVHDLDIEAITVTLGQFLTATSSLLGSTTPALFAVDEDDDVEEDDDEDLDDDEDDEDWEDEEEDEESEDEDDLGWDDEDEEDDLDEDEDE